MSKEQDIRSRFPNASASFLRLNGHLLAKPEKPQNHGTSWRQGWREIKGIRIYFRSRWEYNYALYLDFLSGNGHIKKWEHEPETFWFEKIKRGCRSYLPDFRVTFQDNRIEYHEVKGWMDPRSITKLKRMKKYHPNIVLKVIDCAWFKANAPKLRAMIPKWEIDGHTPKSKL